MTTELGIPSVNKEGVEHQSDNSKVEEPHAQYISAVVEAICRNQLATLKHWCMYLENLPRYKKEAIWTTCKTLPSFSNFNRNSFLQTIQSWEENPVRNMSSISVLYTAICFLQSEAMLPEIPPKGEPNYEYNPSMAKEFQSPSRDTTIPPSKQQYVQQSPIPSSYSVPQPSMQYIPSNYGTPPVYTQMQPQHYMQNPQMHYQDPSQLHLPLPQQNVPMMHPLQSMGMSPNGIPGMYPQQNMNPYMMQQPSFSPQQQMMAQPPNMQGHALGACPGCRQVLKYPQAATIVRCPKCNTTLQPQQLQQQLQQQFPQHQVQMLHQQLQSGTLQVQPQAHVMQQPQFMQPHSSHNQNNHSSRNVSTPNSSKNKASYLQQPHQFPQLQQPMQPLHQQPQSQGHSSVNSLLNTPVITPSSFMPLAPPNQMTVNSLNIPQGMKTSMPSLNPPDFGQKLPLPKPWNGSHQRSYMDNPPPPSLSPILNPTMHSRQAVTHEITLDGTSKSIHPKPFLEKDLPKKPRQEYSNSQESNAGTLQQMETVNIPLGSSQDRPILLEEPSPMRVELNERPKEEYAYEPNPQQMSMQQEGEQQGMSTAESEKDSMVQSFFAETDVQQ